MIWVLFLIWEVKNISTLFLCIISYVVLILIFPSSWLWLPSVCLSFSLWTWWVPSSVGTSQASLTTPVGWTPSPDLSRRRNGELSMSILHEQACCTSLIEAHKKIHIHCNWRAEQPHLVVQLARNFHIYVCIGRCILVPCINCVLSYETHVAEELPTRYAQT